MTHRFSQQKHAGNRQHNRQSHPGQARASARKRGNRWGKKLELLETAQAKGMTVVQLVRQRAVQIEDINVHSMIAAEAERQRIPAVSQPTSGSWLAGFRDDDRRWKW